MKNTKDITLIALMSSLVFAQEQLLVFLPNIQLTAFLLILFSKKFGFIRTSLIILIYVILDNFVMGSFNLVFTPFMLLGWLFIPFIFSVCFKRIESSILLSVISIITSLAYCWIYIIPNYILYGINPIIYLSSDFIFEIIFVICNFSLVMILYSPCSKLIEKLFKSYSL